VRLEFLGDSGADAIEVGFALGSDAFMIQRGKAFESITHSSACSAGARKRLSATDAKGQVSDATYISTHVFDS